MYRYDEFDAQFVRERAEQFRGQVARRLAGELTEDEFKPLRLMNGLYLQLHSYMLRIAIPYGTLSSRQLRKLAHIARKYDRGYGHFTTRQNLQLHWVQLPEVPDVLLELAEVEMHCLQTSGNCVRNITADHFAAAGSDEIEDPRILSEILRQWSTLHPEFSFLPRKFKIAVSGSQADRAAIMVHDIGIQIVRNDQGEVGYRVYVGGGLGRTPFIGHEVGHFVAKADILAFTEAIMRVYNESGRRDNIHKARIKILVHQIGPEEMRKRVEREFAEIRASGTLQLPEAEMQRIAAYFALPSFEELPDTSPELEKAKSSDPAFANWVRTNVDAHKVPGYAIATISLKPIGQTPGDCSSDQMDALADLMDEFGQPEIRVTHEQNLVLPHVRKRDLYAIWKKLDALDLGTAKPWPRERHHLLPRSRLLRPRQCAVDQHRQGDRAPLCRSRTPARSRRAEDQDLGLHQCLRPSPCRPHRHPGRRPQRRGELPDPARRLGRGGRVARRDPRARISTPKASRTRSRTWSRPTPS